MSDINYSIWFKKDYWTYEEAACLFTEDDANDEILKLLIDPITRHKFDNNALIKTLVIFERADWNQFGEAPPRKRNFNDYFVLAEQKNLKVPNKLQEARKQYEAEHINRVATASNSEVVISKKMFKTLKETILNIEMFKDEFKKEGKKTKQKDIEEWLWIRGCNTRDAGHIKSLISNYYGITTSRKGKTTDKK